MSREILVKISLEFDDEDKHRVENLIKDKFGGSENIEESLGDCICFFVWNDELEEEDFEEFKKCCNYISKSEYEFIDEGCFVWEKEEDGEK